MAMCQCGLFGRCNNHCDFCLLKEGKTESTREIHRRINLLIDNINFIAEQPENWTNKFSNGISIIGGEIYALKDQKYKEMYLHLIDVIIEKILKVSPDPWVRYSTVSNGIYDPEWLLFPVMDKINAAVGISKVDMNFSYDMDFRYHTAHAEELAVRTINQFSERYPEYTPGVQMILTQKLIDRVLYDGLRLSKLAKEKFPNAQLSLLYPHPINRGNGFAGERNLEGFNFTRESFLKFLSILKDDDPVVCRFFVQSCYHSAIFKYTMLNSKKLPANQLPALTGGKEIINPECGHSALYQCYADSDKCMLCDLEDLNEL